MAVKEKKGGFHLQQYVELSMHCRRPLIKLATLVARPSQHQFSRPLAQPQCYWVVPKKPGRTCTKNGKVPSTWQGHWNWQTTLGRFMAAEKHDITRPVRNLLTAIPLSHAVASYSFNVKFRQDLQAQYLWVQPIFGRLREVLRNCCTCYITSVYFYPHVYKICRYADMPVCGISYH